MSRPRSLASILGLLLLTWHLAYAGQPGCSQLLQEFVRAYQCGVGPPAQVQPQFPSEACTASELYATRPVLSLALGHAASSPFLYEAINRISRDLNLSVMVHPNSSDISQYDVAIMNAAQLGALLGGINSTKSRLVTMESKVLGPLSGEHFNGDWYSVDATLRLAVATYGASEAGVAFSGSGGAQILYRRDVLESAGIKVQQLATWAGLAKAVATLGIKDFNKDGWVDMPFCWNLGGDCGATTLLSMISPFLQARGRHEGMLMDIPTQTLLLNSSVVQVAMAIFQKLHTTGPTLRTECLPYNELFLTGRCAITFSPNSEAFKYYSSDPRSQVRGLFGVAPVPGSDVILDRATMQVVACDPDSCPHAAMHELEDNLQDPHDGNLVGTNIPNDYSTLGIAITGSTLVNRAPYLSDTLLGVISADLPPSVRGQAVQLLLSLVNSTSSWDMVTTLGSGVSPFRYDHWEVSGENMPREWLEAKFDAQALPAYLDAIDTTVSWGGNSVPPLQMPGQDIIFKHLKQAVDKLTRGQPPSQVAQQLNDGVSQAMLSIYLEWSQFVDEYKAGISYQEGLRKQLVLTDSSVGNNSSISHNVAIIISCVLGSLTVALGTWLLLSQAKRRHRDGLGRIKPPDVSSDTTLLVAIMQDLELLKQDFAPDVVERTLEIWTGIAAGCLSKFTGYQMPTSTPGKLNVAFYSPGDAAMFSLRFQKLLMTAKWPRQVLDHPVFAPVYMEPLTDVLAADKQMVLDASPIGTKSFGKPPVEDLYTAQDDMQELSVSQLVMKRKASTTDLCEDASKCMTFGQQCAASWVLVDAGKACASPTSGELQDVKDGAEEETDDQLKLWKTKRSQSCRMAPQNSQLGSDGKAVLVSRGPQVCISVCAVCASPVTRIVDDASGRMVWSGEPMCIASQLASCGQGGMILVPQQTFRQLPVEVMSEKHLFCHFGEYLLLPSLPPLDVYLTLDKNLLGLLSAFKALDPSPTGMAVSPGVLAAPVERAAMVFTHIVGVQALLAWNYDVTHAALDTFTRLAQNELRNHAGYLVEHVSGFMLSAFQQPGAAILWALKLQELMIEEQWSEELLSHEMCEEVIVSSDSRDQAVPEDARVSKVDGYSILYRGPRLKTGIDLGPILSALNTVTGRMAYRGKVMNRAARIASVASSGQVLCSSEALTAAFGPQGITLLQDMLAQNQPPPVPGRRNGASHSMDAARPESPSHHGAIPPKPAACAVQSPTSGSHPTVKDTTKEISSVPASPMPRPTQQAVVQAKSLGLFQLKGIAERIEVFHCYHERPNLDVIARRPSMRLMTGGSRKNSMLVAYTSKNSSNAGSNQARKCSGGETQPRRLSQGIGLLEQLYAQGLGVAAPSSTSSSQPDNSLPWTAGAGLGHGNSSDCFTSDITGHKAPVQSPAPACLTSHPSIKSEGAPGGGGDHEHDEHVVGYTPHSDLIYAAHGPASYTHHSKLQDICEDLSEGTTGSGGLASPSAVASSSAEMAMTGQPLSSRDSARHSKTATDEGSEDASHSPVPRGGADHPRLPRAARSRKA